MTPNFIDTPLKSSWVNLTIKLGFWPSFWGVNNLYLRYSRILFRSCGLNSTLVMP